MCAWRCPERFSLLFTVFTVYYYCNVPLYFFTSRVFEDFLTAMSRLLNDIKVPTFLKCCHEHSFREYPQSSFTWTFYWDAAYWHSLQIGIYHIDMHSYDMECYVYQTAFWYKVAISVMFHHLDLTTTIAEALSCHHNYVWQLTALQQPCKADSQLSIIPPPWLGTSGDDPSVIHSVSFVDM